MAKLPSAPRGAGPSGRRLWRSVVGDFELDEHEVALLVEAVRTVDQLDRLDAVVAEEGVMERGTGRAHPALVEARQQRLTLARLLATLRLPAGDVDDTPAAGARPQRRGAARGAYGRRTP